MSAWKEIIRRIAPTIGATLGGPLAGTATKFIADKLLGRPDATDTEIESFITGATPEQLIELKRLDTEFKTSMAALGVDLFKLEVEDRGSARDLAVNTSLVPQMILSVVYNVGYFIILYVVLSKAMNGGMNLPEELKMVVGVLLGVMTVEIPRINAFWFGSSMGSKFKDLLGMNKKRGATG